jgi:hypothetical protein
MKRRAAVKQMKPTTIRLPDDLLKRAKLWAVESDTTLQQLIIEGLNLRLSQAPRSLKK